MKWTSKVQAVVMVIVSGVTGYVAYFVALPPNLQTGILGQIVGIAPPSWQPAIASTTKTISIVASIWAGYKASQSGPQTPPPNSLKE